MVTGLAFAVFGLVWGAFQVLLADLVADLDVSPGPLGVAFSVGTVGSLVAMPLGGRAAARLGLRQYAVGTGLLFGLSTAAFAAVPAYPALVGLLLVHFATSGVYDVGVNAAGIGHERASGRHALPYLHAGFSGGGVIGALGAGALLALGVPFRSVYLLLGAAVWLAMVPVWRRGLPEPGRAGAAVGGAGFALARERALLLVAAVTGLGFFLEGAMEEWSTIYLRAELSVPALVGSAGPAVFHAAMLGGRLATGGVIGRVGRRATLRGAGLLATAGMALAVATEAAPVALLGFLAVGLGLAAVSPIAFSLAGDLAPGRAAETSATLTTVGYAGFLLGPALIGGAAEVVGLRAALGLAGLLGLAVAGLAGRVGRT